jgi:hypothetical protein
VNEIKMKVDLAIIKEEVKRLEKTSFQLTYIFGLLWGALLFFIIENVQNNPIALEIYNNTLTSLSQINSFQNMLSYILFCLLLFFIPLTFIILITNMSQSILNNKTLTWKEYAENKNENLKKALTTGILSSILLILYFGYLTFLGNVGFVSLLKKIEPVFLVLTIIFCYIIFPIYELKQIKKSPDKISKTVNLVSSILFIITGCFFLALIFFPNQITACLQSANNYSDIIEISFFSILVISILNILSVTLRIAPHIDGILKGVLMIFKY